MNVRLNVSADSSVHGQRYDYRVHRCTHANAKRPRTGQLRSRPMATLPAGERRLVSGGSHARARASAGRFQRTCGARTPAPAIIIHGFGSTVYVGGGGDVLFTPPDARADRHRLALRQYGTIRRVLSPVHTFVATRPSSAHRTARALPNKILYTRSPESHTSATAVPPQSRVRTQRERLLTSSPQLSQPIIIRSRRPVVLFRR